MHEGDLPEGDCVVTQVPGRGKTFSLAQNQLSSATAGDPGCLPAPLLAAAKTSGQPGDSPPRELPARTWLAAFAMPWEDSLSRPMARWESRAESAPMARESGARLPVLRRR